MNDPKMHGGTRPGAGRKRSELTTLIRVPNSSVLEIKAFLKKAKADPEIDHIRQVDPVTHMAISHITRQPRQIVFHTHPFTNRSAATMTARMLMARIAIPAACCLVMPPPRQPSAARGG